MNNKKGEQHIVSRVDPVNEYMLKLTHPLKDEVEALRSIIKNANSKIAERIKWNAPSYFYKMDMAAFNLRTQMFVQVIFIFPKGLISTGSGLLLGDWKDRREARFANMAEVLSKKAALETLINNWVELIEP